MCLILFAYRLHRQRPLVVAANRDEFYARPAKAAHWWGWDGWGWDGVSKSSSTEIFGGRDLKAGGTWLAASRNGRLAAVTNWTEDRSAPQPPGSRGDLPRLFLAEKCSARDFVGTIDGDRYAGFNFIGFDGEELIYASNRTGEIRALDAGVYGLTNTRLGPALARQEDGSMAFRTGGATQLRASEPWPKAVFGAAALTRIAQNASTDDLIELLAQAHLPLETPPDRERAPERSYSPCFIHGTEYGTRASTAIILQGDSLEFVERQYGPHGKPGARSATTIRFDA